MRSNKDLQLQIGLSASILVNSSGKKPLDGMGVYTQSLLNEFVKSGLLVQPYIYPSIVKGYQYEALPASFMTLALKDMLGFANPLKMPVDLFHVTDYKAVRMTCPVVTTLYDAIPFVDPGMGSSRFRALKNFVLRRSAECADHVIAISNYSVKELVEHYRVAESKISVVHCGVDDSWLDSRPTVEQVDNVLRHHGLAPGYFLTVGTLQPRKNVQRLLQAHSQLAVSIRKAHPLVVIGKRGWNCDALVAELEEKVLHGEARWLQNIDSREDLKCFYAGAEAFLFPSLYEGFGLPVLEAFAMGLPVLTSKTTSLPEVSNGIGLEVDPLNLGEMADAMLQLTNLPDRAIRVEAGKARAQELSWSRCANETLKVYNKVLEGR